MSTTYGRYMRAPAPTPAAPAVERPAAPPPPRTREVAAGAIKELRAIQSGRNPSPCPGFRTLSEIVDPLDWARVLRVRHESGEQLLPIQIETYKAALGIA